MARAIWFSNWNFRIPHVNGKYPSRYTLVPEERLMNNFAVDHGIIITKRDEELYLTQVTGLHTVKTYL